MACSTGCPTQDHETYGACLRSKRLQVESAEARKHDQSLMKQLDNYQAARRAGLQPQTVFKKDVDAAWKITEQNGEPYRADKD